MCKREKKRAKNASTQIAVGRLRDMPEGQRERKRKMQPNGIGRQKGDRLNL